MGGALGDKGGMTISQWNMQVLAAAPPPLKGKGAEKAAGKAASAGGTPTLPLILAAAAAAVLLIGGVILLGRNGPTVTPTETPVRITPSPTATHTPTPTPTVVPELSVALAAGCDEEYDRDATLTILIDSSVHGTVDVSWVDPQGNEEHLFQDRVEGQDETSHRQAVPDIGGDWRLEGDLNNGMARDTCRFIVDTGPNPRCRSGWRKAGGHTYRPGASLTVQAMSNVAGSLVVEWRDPSRGTELLFEEQVAAGQVVSQIWSAPEMAGGWLLRAELASTPAQDDCAFDIVIPEVTIELEDGCDRTYQACQAPAVRLASNVSGEVDVTLLDGEPGGQLQYSERLLAGRDVSRSWEVPRIAGDWTLEAVLEDGEATGLCEFRIDADSTGPVIEEIGSRRTLPVCTARPSPPDRCVPGTRYGSMPRPATHAGRAWRGPS